MHERSLGECQRVRDTVAKLMALGSSPNEHEAAAAIRKARCLMLQHEIEFVESDEERFGVVQLGPIRRRRHAWEYTLAQVLAEFFFVKVIWSRSYDSARLTSGHVLHVYGTHANLEMAGYVHSFLSQVMDVLWERHRSRAGLADNRGRLRYMDGVLRGFGDRLREQDAEVRETGALVWKGDVRLDCFFRYHNPRTRTVYGQVTAGSRAFEAGQRDGRTVRLSRPIATNSNSLGGYLSGDG